MQDQHDHDLTHTQQVIFGIASLVIVTFSGVCSGLTVGIFSLDSSRLQVMTRVGQTEWQRNSARRLLWFVSRGHWTLVTLLVSNASAMSALPLVLEQLVSAEVSIILSISAVLFFGEVVPQALFVRHAFAVCSWCVPLLWLLLIVTTVISYPAAILLDKIVGHQAKIGRDEVEKHVRIVEEIAEGSTDEDEDENDDDASKKAENGTASGEYYGGGGAQTNDGGINQHDLETNNNNSNNPDSLLPEEIRIMKGALALAKKTLQDVKGVAPENAFMLSSSQELDPSLIDKIVSEGYSRVPVFMGSDRNHVIGVLLTRCLLSLAYSLSQPVHQQQQGKGDNNNNKSQLAVVYPKVSDLSSNLLREPFRVQENTKVTDLLTSFKTGKSHLACVYNKNGSLVKFVTLEDLFQVLLIGDSKGKSGKQSGKTVSNNTTTSAPSSLSVIESSNTDGISPGQSNNTYPPTPYARNSTSVQNNSTHQHHHHHHYHNNKEVERAVLVASTFNVIRQSTAMAS
jgi:metal transporter CNNM